MTLKKDKVFFWCLVFLGMVIYSAQAQEQGLGSVFFNPIFRKLIVCNYNGVCQSLHLNKLFDQRGLQKRDSWKRIMKTPGFDNGPSQLTSLGDPTRKLEILKREEPKMENESRSRLKKGQV